MSIDNQPLAIDTSALATNVSIVAYDCSAGSGNTEYTDRLRILEPVLDITPYQKFLNLWLTAGAALATLALTLPQAKLVKIGYLEGIFNSKRQAPIAALGQTWDASDAGFMGMQGAVASWDVAASVNASDANIADQVNTMGITTNTATQTQTQTATQTGVGGISYSMTTIGAQPNVVIGPIGNPSATSASQSNSQSTSQSSSSHTGIAAPTVAQPNVPWPALNATATTNLTMGQMRSLISSINTRRSSLQSTRITKRNAINALTTIPAVIAYDATTGWPF